MRAIHIYCDGGFGNRFNALVSGLALCEATGLQPLVIWPLNNWCGARFDALFKDPRPVVERELRSYVPVHAEFQFLTIEDHLRIGMPYRSPLQMGSMAEVAGYLSQSDADVHFHTPLIPAWVSLEEAKRLVRTLPFQDAIEQRAQAFLRQHDLVDFFGVQIRKTDFGSNGADDENLHALISRCPHKRFFVCSDDKAVEARFAALSNVVIHAKTAHVEKLVLGEWTTPTADHSGRIYACNVNRSAQSVIDAVVDLLILSRSQIVKTSNSTFLNTALLLQASR